MKGILTLTKNISRMLNVIGGIALVFIVVLTVADVILRAFRVPILGTYEIVSLSGSVVILFALPLTTWSRGHIYVDFVVIKFPPKVREVFNIATRCLVFFLFFLSGWNMIKYGMDLHGTAEVSPTLKLPFYPVVYAVGVCCFVQCLVLITDVVKIIGGKYGE
jgi:TRAP-type C4-dicarboxylate transport system permease small subunit